MHKFRKRLTWILVIMIIVNVALWYLGRVLILKRPDGITTMQDFYVQDKETVDVLFVGSSNTGMNIDLAYLWSEYGVSGYSLWGSAQPFWNTYYYLKEALQYQTPKVVVLDVYAATFDFEYSDEARQVTNIEGMKFGANKLDAVRATSPKERWFNMILEYPIFHSRYSELTKDDFEHFPWNDERKNFKGNGCRYGIGNVELCDVSDITEKHELMDKEEKYLLMIIELCKQKGIPLVFIKTPTAHREGEQPYYNTVKEIAEYNDVEFYNFNLLDEETGFTSEDYWTDDTHVNTNGARKITKYLANYLKYNYELADHRNDIKFESWDKNQISIENEYIASITDGDEWFEELTRTDRNVIMIKNSSWDDSEEWDALLQQLEKIGCDKEVLRHSAGDWLIQKTASNRSFENKYFGGMYSEFEFDGKLFSVDFKDGNGVQIDGKKVYDLNGPGIIILVYDSNIHELVDIVNCLKLDKYVFSRVEKNN